MSSIQAKVAEFHKTFGHPVRDGAQPLPSREEAILAFKLIEEEFMELAEAMFGEDISMGRMSLGEIVERYNFPYAPNLIKVADALGDMNVVIHGAALRHGMDMDRIDDAVHTSNMSKLGVNGKPVYHPNGKIKKGPNFREPDIAGALGL